MNSVKKNNDLSNLLLQFLPWILIAIASFLLGRRVFGNENSAISQFVLQSLSQKQKTVLSLTGGSAAISTAISLLPGDAATPLANSFSNITNYLVISLAAVFAEKYLLTVIGSLVFVYCIPVVCIAKVVLDIFRRNFAREIAVKIILMSICIYTVIPVSEVLTTKIWRTYEANIHETVNSFVEDSDAIAQDTEELEMIEQEDEESSGVWSQIQKMWNQGVEWVGNAIDTVTLDVGQLLQKAQNAFNNFVEAAAIMVVTSCVFPVLVIMLGKWLINLIVQMRLPSALFRHEED